MTTDRISRECTKICQLYPRTSQQNHRGIFPRQYCGLCQSFRSLPWVSQSNGSHSSALVPFKQAFNIDALEDILINGVPCKGLRGAADWHVLDDRYASANLGLHSSSASQAMKECERDRGQWGLGDWRSNGSTSWRRRRSYIEESSLPLWPWCQAKRVTDAIPWGFWWSWREHISVS